MADSPFSGERAAALCERLGEPDRLVSLTPLGTRAMRQRMLAEGREAGLVGELAGASPAELLGTVAEHYTPDTTAQEIAIWRARHGVSLDPLVQAIRDCPFVSRRVALLQTLVKAVPEGGELLASLLGAAVADHTHVGRGLSGGALSGSPQVHSCLWTVLCMCRTPSSRT